MKSRSFAFRRAVLSLLALSVVLFNFASCKTEDEGPEYVNNYIYVLPLEEDSNLVGSWTSSYSSGTEVYKITSSTFDNSGSYTYNGETITYNSYAGNNLVVSYTNDDKTAGYIYIKYTRAYCSTHSYVYDTDAADVGKWYAVAFKDLTSSSVSLSGAYGTVSSTSTLDEAVKTFTVANGYFSYYSECAKSE